MDANVGEAGIVDLGEQAGQPIDEGLAADQTDIGPDPRLGREMLAAAETDFEPHRLWGMIEQGDRVEFRPQRDPQVRQQLLDQGLAARAQLLAVTPPIQYSSLYQLSAAVSVSTRSRRSQEKPPSSSGARPKWP